MGHGWDMSGAWVGHEWGMGGTWVGHGWGIVVFVFGLGLCVLAMCICD